MPESYGGADYKEWQCPAQAVPPERRLQWINSATEEGQAWLRSQRGYSDWRRAMDTISGKMNDIVPEYRSHLNTNHLKTDIREVVGAMSKLRPLWGYSSDNPAYRQHAELFNKVTRAWYLESFCDISIKECLQYASVTCTGWARPAFRRKMAGTGKGEIKVFSYGAPCVLPIQLPSSNDYQEAYAVTLLDEMPIYMAHGMWPLYQQQLRPTSSLYWYASEVRQSARGNIFKRIFSWGKTDSTSAGLSDLLVPVRYTYVNDLSINTTSMPIPMGEIGTSWSYIVPFLGQDIEVGVDAQGNRLTRKATVDDARLYPRRRLLISSEAVIMYDGPAFDWHGRLPLIPFSMDKWPWEPIGFALTRDGYDIQLSINELERGFMDKERARMDMALAYDINAVSKREATEFDPMQPRARLGFDGTQVTKPFELPIPPEVLKTEAITLEFIEHLKDTMDSQLALKDAMALARARMSPDDMEKVLESQGPIIEDMSRGMEPPMRELADQIKFLIMQYYTTGRVMQVVGPDDIPRGVFDYDPAALVPSHMPGESPDAGDSKADKVTRARTFADNLRFFITPRSLHELTQMAMKLGLIQLRKAGVQIDSQTIAEAWSVPNYGTIEGSTVREKFQREQEENLEFAARMKELGASLSGAAGGQPPGAAAPGKNPEGRPPSGQAAPKLVQKDGGARATITESR